MGWLDMAIDLAKQFEGCSLKAYPDQVYGWRRATIGYGATGPSICMNTAWTQAQADTDLEYRMRGLGAHIDSAVTVSISDEHCTGASASRRRLTWTSTVRSSMNT